MSLPVEVVMMLCKHIHLSCPCGRVIDSPLLHNIEISVGQGIFQYPLYGYMMVSMGHYSGEVFKLIYYKRSDEMMTSFPFVSLLLWITNVCINCIHTRQKRLEVIIVAMASTLGNTTEYHCINLCSSKIQSIMLQCNRRIRIPNDHKFK